MALWGCSCNESPHFPPLLLLTITISSPLHPAPVWLSFATSSSLPVDIPVCLPIASSLPPLPPSSLPQLHLVFYCTGTTWVSPPEDRSCIRLPETGRFTPVAQLKNILEENKDTEAVFWNTGLFLSAVQYDLMSDESVFKTIRRFMY